MLSSTGDSNIRSYTWASYNLPTQVTKGSTGSAWATFVYGPSREKLRQTSYSSGLSNRTIVYLNAYSERHTTSSGDEYREHIVAPTGVVAQVSYYPSTATRTTLYVHTDKLGSVDAMSNTAGQNLALSTSSPGFGYDRWGKRRDDSGAASPSSYNFATLKGFTGHEMLDTVGLIHMGGRVFDPTIGRFLSPDPFIQDPNNLQSYNRYSYVMNNPLSAVDPTGFFGLSDITHAIGDALSWAKDNWRMLAAVAVAVMAPYAMAAYLGTTVGGLSMGAALTSGALGGFAAGMIGSGGDLKAGLIGAVSGMAFAGIGQSIGKGVQWGDWGRMLDKAVAHGIVGGAISVVQGGNFGQGFASTGVSAFFAPGIDAATTNDATGVLLSAALGGTVSAIGGGKFANGAVTSAFSYALNQATQARIRDGELKAIADEANRIGKVLETEGVQGMVREFPALTGLSDSEQQMALMSLSADLAGIEIEARALIAGRYAYENSGLKSLKPSVYSPLKLLGAIKSAAQIVINFGGGVPTAIAPSSSPVGFGCGSRTCDVWVGDQKVNLSNMGSH